MSVGHSQPTVSWHMSRLLRLGVVGKKRTSKGLVYEVLADHDDVLRFVKSYHPQVWRRWALRLTDLAVSARERRLDKAGPQGVGLTPPAMVELIGHS